MRKPKVPDEILLQATKIKGKRARIVVEHILKHGRITTDDLKKQYGYDHPPRAIKDVTDQGLPLARTFIKNEDGKRIAEYTFGDPSGIRHGRLGGRQTFSKAFKTELVKLHSNRCALCMALLDPRYLQVDHRVPYEVAGEDSELKVAEFMPVCGSCNRAKSWSCEHCPNQLELRDPQVCQNCYWAQPADYTHVAMEDIRRLAITWQGEEAGSFDTLKTAAKRRGVSPAELAKALLARILLSDSKRTRK